MDILNKIEKLRKEKGWSIYKLALEAGITTSTLTNMLARKTLPSITTLIALCDAFEITLAQFFADENCNETLSYEELELLQNYRKLSSNNKKVVVDLCKNIK